MSSAAGVVLTSPEARRDRWSASALGGRTRRTTPSGGRGAGAVAVTVAALRDQDGAAAYVPGVEVVDGRLEVVESVFLVGISSNDVVTYPQDGPDQMVAEGRRHGWTFPYLYDETQDVARAYSAACTPDTFVFDGERRLVYRGQLDDSRPRNDLPVTAADVRAAVDAVLAGRPVDPDQRPSIGCGIKWR
jgi:hypothetical protein